MFLLQNNVVKSVCVMWDDKLATEGENERRKFRKSAECRPCPRRFPAVLRYSLRRHALENDAHAAAQVPRQQRLRRRAPQM